MIKTISIAESKFSVDTNGGKISEMILDGVKVLGTYERMDGKIGATHICTPNFAGEGVEKYGLPFHGPARTLEWEIVKEDDKSLEMKVVLEALGKYVSALEVRQIFALHRLDSSHSFRMTDSESSSSTVMLSLPKHPENIFFSHEVHVKNLGTVAAPVNIAIHNYFDTPSGWEGARLNDKSIKEKIEKNLSIHASKPIERGIWNLEFGTSQSLLIETQGAHDLMCWTSTKDGKYDQNYACVEPVVSCDPAYFGSEASLLPPGETRSMSQKIYYKL